ncbi:MAG: hypothetical protein ACMUIL_04080 [bacterium]
MHTHHARMNGSNPSGTVDTPYLQSTSTGVDMIRRLQTVSVELL